MQTFESTWRPKMAGRVSAGKDDTICYIYSCKNAKSRTVQYNNGDSDFDFGFWILEKAIITLHTADLHIDY